MSRTSNNAKSRSDTRERIIATAEALAATPNFRDFTLNEIAEHMGVHYTGVYHYFENRDHLILELIERYATRRCRYIADARQSPGSAADHLADFVLREMHEQSSALIMRGRSTLSEPYRSEAIKAYQRTRQALTHLIEDGQQDRSFRPFNPPLAAHIILRTLDRYASYNEPVFVDAKLDADSLAHELIGFFQRGIAPEALENRHPGKPAHLELRPLGPPRLNAILEKACTSFNTLGWRGTSIPQIAKEIGMSKTTFYRYAASKEDLLFLCATHTISLLAQVRQTSVACSENPLQALLLDTYFLRSILAAPPGPLLSPYLFDRLSDEHRRFADESFTAYRMELVDLLEQCVAGGFVRPLNAPAVQPMITACSYIPIEPGEDTDNGYMDDVARFMLTGLGNR